MLRLAILLIILYSSSSLYAVNNIIAVIPGRGVVEVPVSSTQAGSTAYIGGMEAGNVPLLEYSVVWGGHEMQVGQSGFMDHEKAVTLTVMANEGLNPTNGESQMTRRTDVGAGVFYLVPLDDGIEPTVLYTPFSLAHAIGMLQPGMEFSFSIDQRHDMELISPLNTPFTMERFYNLIMFHVYLNVLPFKERRRVLPYAGVAVGLVHLWDYRINQVAENNEELIISQTRFSLGSKIGVSFLPFSVFSIFLESRFYWQPERVDRPIFVSQGLGSEMAQVSNKTRLNYFALGGGFKFFF
jgi:hypothetical protein